MSIIEIIKQMSCWYITALIVLSLYYSIRGIMEIHIKLKNNKELNKFQKIFVHYIQEFLFKAIVTISGFISLFVANHIFSSFKNIGTGTAGSINDIGTGTAILLIFLIIWGVCGISGYLTFLIVKGKFPGSKG